MNTDNKMGNIRKGWELTKSSWRVLILDKELAVLPILGIVLSLAVIASIMALYVATGIYSPESWKTSGEFDMGYWKYLFLASTAYAITLISYFFTGAIIYGATDRFKGNDPTIRSCLRAARGKLKPLAQYSLMMASVGFLLNFISERVPFGGRIALRLFNGAWNIANFFALPFIILSDKNVRPFDATRESVKLIKKIWGESIAATISVGIIALFFLLIYTVLFGLAVVGLETALSSVVMLANPTIAITMLGLGLLGLFGIMMVFATLEGITKAALYYYATTGKSPAAFNKDLLRAAMTPKKAKKIFG